MLCVCQRSGENYLYFSYGQDAVKHQSILWPKFNYKVPVTVLGCKLVG